MKSWILTFNRPQALNRQIDALLDWTDVWVFSNHPEIALSPKNMEAAKAGKINFIHNNLSDKEANSYCARSWNNIFLKHFKDADEGIFIQDDTFITNPAAFKSLILTNKERYDLIWGPGGDQFFYAKKSILQTVGWFDERYLGCYCGDADWLKRIWQQYDQNKLSVYETHDWGFIHNDVGIGSIIPTHIGAKAVDANYVNQHHEIEKIVGVATNRILEHSQAHYNAKWGHMLNGTGPISRTDLPFGSLLAEIDWYPWFTKKYLGGK